MKTVIIDNWLEPDLADYLCLYLEETIVYQAGHKSNMEDDSCILKGQVLFTPLIQFLLFKLNKLLKVHMLTVYTNLQYQNMDGRWHSDDGDVTFLYMSSKKLQSDEGHFEIKGEGKYEYKFNRLIYFDASKPHKGNSPRTNVPRITLAFKTKHAL